MSTEVFLVPHTHWDREWYEPFQRFRLRLVDLSGCQWPHTRSPPFVAEGLAPRR
jgi:hypothetical protein